MTAPYTLRLFSSVLNTTPGFMANLVPIAKGWRRSIRAGGGFWLGSFSMTVDGVSTTEDDIQAAFDTWLGCHVQEGVGATTSWEGMIYEMDLHRDGVVRRRSLDMMANAVQSTFTKFDWTGELIDNGDFEIVSGGDFDGWYEGSGVSDGAPTVVGGSHSCKITSDGVTETVDGGVHLTNTWIRQNVSVVAGDNYKLDLWGYGKARIGLLNPNAPTSWLIIPQPVSLLTSWRHRTWYFSGPVGSEVLLYLYPGTESGEIGIFDDVSIQERGEVVAETDWVTNADSVGRYGRREEILYLDDYPLASSEARRDAFLAQNAQPFARPVSAGRPGETRLMVTVAGYAHTANWQFVQEGDGDEEDLDDRLRTVVGTDYGLSVGHGGTSSTAGDCQFLKVGNVATNTLQVVALSTVDIRGWEQITELVDLGIDDTGDTDTPDFMPTRAWVGPGRLLHYGMVDRLPKYFLRKGGIYDRLSSPTSVSPWLVQPAVIRDQSYPVKRDLSGSFLEDARDMWVEEVEVDASGGVLLKTALFRDEDEALARRLDYFGAGEVIDPLLPSTTPPWWSTGG